jgi:hypothetical protein
MSFYANSSGVRNVEANRPWDCLIDNHILCGIPVKSCLNCKKMWLTGDDPTPENEIESYEVRKLSDTFSHCEAFDVKYKSPDLRKVK